MNSQRITATNMTSGHAGFVAVGGNHDDHLPPGRDDVYDHWLEPKIGGQFNISFCIL